MIPLGAGGIPIQHIKQFLIFGMTIASTFQLIYVVHIRPATLGSEPQFKQMIPTTSK